jgi:hypothetical protein
MEGVAMVLREFKRETISIKVRIPGVNEEWLKEFSGKTAILTDSKVKAQDFPTTEKAEEVIKVIKHFYNYPLSIVMEEKYYKVYEC